MTFSVHVLCFFFDLSRSRPGGEENTTREKVKNRVSDTIREIDKREQDRRWLGRTVKSKVEAGQVRKQERGEGKVNITTTDTGEGSGVEINVENVLEG